jgi:hypothetical protein
VTKKRNILFQAYGNTGVKNECRYALLQLSTLPDIEQYNVVLYTDDPAFFKPVLALFVHSEQILLTAHSIQQWRGAINFVHRVKIEMLLHFYSSHTGAVLYFDTDTYCTAPIQALFEKIENNCLLMHEYEGNLGKKNSIVLKKWERFFNTHTVATTNGAVKEPQKIAMWNAGVLGINDQHSYLLKEVLDLTDKIYPMFPKHTVEQFSFSYYFQQQGNLQGANHQVFHYWDLKEYRLLLQQYFAALPANAPAQSLLKLFKAIPPPMQLMQEKMRYKKLPFYKKWFSKKWSIQPYLNEAVSNQISNHLQG